MIDADERKALSETIRHGPAHRLAYEDADLLAENDLRSVRLQLELIKPERALRDHAIRSTVIVFGSARIMSPEMAQDRLVKTRSKIAPIPKANRLWSVRNATCACHATTQRPGGSQDWFRRVSNRKGVAILSS